MNTIEILTVLAAYAFAILGAVLVGLGISAVEDWVDRRRLKRFAKSSKLKARPRWFSSGGKDL